MNPNEDPLFTFQDGEAPRRCFRCEGTLNYCPCPFHWTHDECSEDDCGRCRPGWFEPEAIAEIVTVTGSHALVHAECYDGEAQTLA